jgi:uncharacterized protein YhaN
VRERHDEVKEALAAAERRQRELELDSEAWRLLRDTMKESESGGAQHLGRALAGDVSRRFGELTASRYGTVDIDPHLGVKSIEGGAARLSFPPWQLSVGTRDQLATLLRLAIAESLGSAIVLDDQLVQSDAARLGWFRAALRQAAATVQVIVVTCRLGDYLEGDAGAAAPACVDLAQAIRRAV